MEEAPDYSSLNKIQEIAKREHSRTFFTSPTLIRLFRRLGTDLPRTEFLASAGEIFDESSWNYSLRFAEKVTDIHDRTELGYVISSPYSLDGVKAKPGYAGVPLPGAELAVLNDQVKSKQYFVRLGYHESGDLAVREGPHF
jgi:acetyl-CoA synthetase